MSGREANDPVWITGDALLELGKGEPNLAAHGSVCGAIRDDFLYILDAEDEAAIIIIPDALNEQVAEMVAGSQ